MAQISAEIQAIISHVQQFSDGEIRTLYRQPLYDLVGDVVELPQREQNCQHSIYMGVSCSCEQLERDVDRAALRT